MMKALLTATISLLACSVSAGAAETILEFSPGKLKAEGKLRSGQVMSADAETPFERIRVTGAADELWTHHLFTVEVPKIGTPAYSIVGQVRYENVRAEGYLEMWSLFPDGGRYFSRTLAAAGPMKHLKGTSKWRSFAVSFFLKGAAEPPRRIQLNVVLPKGGTVCLGRLRVVQHAEGESPLAAPLGRSGGAGGRGPVGPVADAWWPDRTGGLIGAVLGTVLGCVGGLIGWLTAKGRARRFATGLIKGIMIFGLALLVAAAAGVIYSQPYGVVYPLALAGVLSVAVPASLLRGVRRRYEQLELRKMQIADTQ